MEKDFQVKQEIYKHFTQHQIKATMLIHMVLAEI